VISYNDAVAIRVQPSLLDFGSSTADVNAYIRAVLLPQQSLQLPRAHGTKPVGAVLVTNAYRPISAAGAAADIGPANAVMAADRQS
jgi:hypothetical protein